MLDFTFDSDKHEYRIEGIMYPSVTQIISGMGLDGFDPRDRADLKYINSLEGEDRELAIAVSSERVQTIIAAGQFGTACHVATELWDNGTLDTATIAGAIMPYLEAWKKFREDSDFTPIIIERRLYHPTYKVPGTIDRVGPLFDKMSIVDIKTSAQSPVYLGLQTAAYKEIYNSNPNIKDSYNKAKKRYGVLLKPDGTYRLEECKDKSDWNAFLSAWALCNWKRKHNLT